MAGRWMMRRPSPAMGVAIAAVVLASAGVVGAHGGDAGKIHACVDPNGNFRIAGDPTQPPDPNAACPEGYRALDWNIQGPQGPQGPGGPAGPAGPEGKQGLPGPAPSGEKHPTRVYRTIRLIRAKDDSMNVRARCSLGGQQILSGGYSLKGATDEWDVILSQPYAADGDLPNSGEKVVGWKVRLERTKKVPSDDGGGLRVTAFVVCGYL